jgi:hypothetical protein
MSHHHDRDKFTLKTAEGYLQIDDTQLDFEVATHSTLVDRVGVEYAKVLDQRDTIKTELKELEAIVAIRLRKEHGRKDAKLTEVMLNQLVITDDDVMEKTREYLDACHEVLKWEGKKESYRARTNMLSNSTKIFLGKLGSNMVVKSKDSEEVAYKQAKSRYIETTKRRRLIEDDEE